MNTWSFLKQSILAKLAKNDTGERICNGMFWSFTGTAIAKLITLIAGIACAHILSKEAYGELSIVRSTINMFVVMGSLGLGVTATKYISQYKKEEKERIPNVYFTTNSFALIAGVVTTLLCISLAGVFSTKFLHQPHLTVSLQIGSVLLFFSIINSVQNGTLSGFEDFKSLALNTLIGGLCESAFMLIGAYFYGTNGAVLGFGVGFIALYVTNKFSIRTLFKQYKISFISLKKIRHANFQIIWNYSLPALFSSILITPVFFLLRAMLVRYSGLDELAIYEAADQWKIIILFIPTAISQIVLPILSSMQKDRATYRKTFLTMLAIISVTVIVLAGGVAACSNFVMGFYGKGYMHPLPLQILCLSTVFSAVAQVIEMAIYSLGKIWNCFYINIFWAAVALLSAYINLRADKGALGIAEAILYAYIISTIMFTVYFHHLINKKDNE
jgi:O-antigen/teichoic acid export membrane protein